MTDHFNVPAEHVKMLVGAAALLQDIDRELLRHQQASQQLRDRAADLVERIRKTGHLG